MRAANCLGIGVLVAWLAGCAVGPDYHAPETPLPKAFVADTGTPGGSAGDGAAAGGAAPGGSDADGLAPGGPARDGPAADGSAPGGPTHDGPAADGAAPGGPARDGPVDLTQWWHSFHDAELDSLIERAVRTNPDVGIALTHLQEARTQEAIYTNGALPEVAASAAGGRGTGSDLTRAGAAPALREADNKGVLNQIRQVAGFSASWELDLFGGYRRAIEAGKYEVGAAGAARDVVLTSVIADVARNYVDMRGLQARLTIIVDNIAAATQSRDLQQAQFDRGLTNELDLQLADRELATLRAELPQIKSEISARQYDIAELLGQYPQELAGELNAPGVLPGVPGRVAAGLPPDLLRRRPDIREAERHVAASTARIGVATANLFPHVALNGGLGTQSDSLGIQGSHIWAFGPSVYWPLLDFGALDAQVSVANLQAHEQLLAYKKTLIAAVRDADSAIEEFSAQRERLKNLGDALDASERAVSLAQQRYDRGLTDFLNVVDAEHQHFTLQDEYTRSRQSTAETFIHLCLALGGGWEPYQDVPPIRRPEPAVIAGVHRVARPDPSPR